MSGCAKQVFSVAGAVRSHHCICFACDPSCWTCCVPMLYKQGHRVLCSKTDLTPIDLALSVFVVSVSVRVVMMHFVCAQEICTLWKGGSALSAFMFPCVSYPTFVCSNNFDSVCLPSQVCG